MATCLAPLAVCAAVALLDVLRGGGIAGPLVAATYVYTPAMLDGLPGLDDAYLGQTWSLAVEMQFYIVWALTMHCGREWSRVRLLRLAACIAAASYGLLILAALDGRASEAYFATPTRLTGLFVGACLAIGAPRLPPTRLILPCAGTILVLGLPYASSMQGISLTVCTFAASLWTASAISRAELGTGIFVAVLDSRPSRWLGERSYSLYLWHRPVFAVIDHHAPSSLSGWLWQWAATFLVATACHRWIEVPARRWLNRHPPRVLAGAAEVSAR